MVPGVAGELGIMENHEPFMTALRDGVIWGRVGSATGPILAAANMGGYVQVLGSRVIVLCDKTRQISDIDIDRVNRIIPILENQLAEINAHPEEHHYITKSIASRKLRWVKAQRAAKEREDRYYS